MPRWFKNDSSPVYEQLGYTKKAWDHLNSENDIEGLGYNINDDTISNVDYDPVEFEEYKLHLEETDLYFKYWEEFQIFNFLSNVFIVFIIIKIFKSKKLSISDFIFLNIFLLKIFIPQLSIITTAIGTYKIVKVTYTKCKTADKKDIKNKFNNFLKDITTINNRCNLEKDIKNIYKS